MNICMHACKRVTNACRHQRWAVPGPPERTRVGGGRPECRVDVVGEDGLEQGRLADVTVYHLHIGPPSGLNLRHLLALPHDRANLARKRGLLLGEGAIARAWVRVRVNVLV